MNDLVPSYCSLTESECKDFAWYGFAFLVIDESGKIVQANNQVELMFGYVKGELKNKPIDLLLREDKREKHAKHLRHYFRDPHERRPLTKGTLVSGVKKNGEKIDVIIALMPFVECEMNYAIACVTLVQTVEESGVLA